MKSLGSDRCQSPRTSRANDDRDGRHLGRGTVLVVEDDRAQMQALSVGLERRGYAVHGAASGLEALDSLARPSFDIVLLDMGLPDVDGLTMCTRIRDWTRRPVIVVSADAVEDRIVTTLEAGADDYVIKPYSMGGSRQDPGGASSRRNGGGLGRLARARRRRHPARSRRLPGQPSLISRVRQAFSAAGRSDR